MMHVGEVGGPRGTHIEDDDVNLASDRQFLGKVPFLPFVVVISLRGHEMEVVDAVMVGKAVFGVVINVVPARTAHSRTCFCCLRLRASRKTMTFRVSSEAATKQLALARRPRAFHRTNRKSRPPPQQALFEGTIGHHESLEVAARTKSQVAAEARLGRLLGGCTVQDHADGVRVGLKLLPKPLVKGLVCSRSKVTLIAHKADQG